MKTELVSIMPAGYGRKRVTIRFRDGKNYSAQTCDMPTVDDYNSESFSMKGDRRIKRARRILINTVKRENNLA